MLFINFTRTGELYPGTDPRLAARMSAWTNEQHAAYEVFRSDARHMYGSDVAIPDSVRNWLIAYVSYVSRPTLLAVTMTVTLSSPPDEEPLPKG